MEITKIVITGGPCAGKSTAMTWIQSNFRQMGYTVLFVSETATEMITGGVAPWTCKTPTEFQKCLIRVQLEKEKMFERAARTMDYAEKILLVCDRGTLDAKAFLEGSEFDEVTEDLGISEISLRDDYDAVFHLVTAAKGAEKFYTTANNSARTETPEEAIRRDDKLIAAWTGHPHFRIIDNSTDFKGKMQRLLSEIASFLGEPEPYEIERKFLIEYPDIKWLESQPACKRVEIVQTYLNSANGEEFRVRQRGADGNYIYTKTTKVKVSDVKRMEVERRLSREQYLELLLSADISKRQIRKTRYCLTYENQYFEIDVYPFWDNKAIVEIELSDEHTEIKFPEQLKIIKEVTDDDSYRNASLAKIQ